MGKQNQLGQWDSNPKVISENVQKKKLIFFFHSSQVKLISYEEAKLDLSGGQLPTPV